jgi:quinol-cytochrome oxidoreductase complex cytochrome b subunit
MSSTATMLIIIAAIVVMIVLTVWGILSRYKKVKSD